MHTIGIVTETLGNIIETLVNIIDMHMSVFVCPPLRLLVTSSVMWRDMDSI